MSQGFVNLHVSSSHSILYGAASPRDIIEWAARYEQPVIALTDMDSFAGTVEFAKVAREAGIKPIIGCELTEPSDSAHPENRNIRCSVTMLARNRKGYEFISRAITNRHLDEKFDLVETIRQADENVVVLVPDAELLTRILNGDARVTHRNVSQRRK